MDSKQVNALKMIENLILNEKVTMPYGRYEDEEYLYKLLQKEGIVALLNKVVSVSPFSAKKRIEILYHSKKNSIDNDMRKYAELFDEFERRNIKYVVLKGKYLTESVYGDVKYKHSNDLDLLINENELDEVKFVLNELGYSQGIFEGKTLKLLSRREIVLYQMESYQLAPYAKINPNYSSHPCALDIHTVLGWKKNEMDDKCLDDFQYCCFDGINYRILADEWFFIHICLHHYKHLNSIGILEKNGAGLRYLCDVYFFFIKKIEKFDMSKLIGLITENQIEKYVYFFLYYGQKLWGENGCVNDFLNRINCSGIKNCVGRIQFKNINYSWCGLFEKWLMEVDDSNRIFSNVINKNLELNEKGEQKNERN